MICFPNAKINLGLRVISKRNDGYHNISSLFLPIPFFDVLEFLPSKLYKLSIFGIEINTPAKDNLVTKAWLLMHQKFVIPPLEIKLFKRIPIASGLGGGSSDASFLIKSVNSYFKLGLSISELEEFALQIGSDCPFFILNKPSIIGGKGEMTEPVNLNLQDKFIVLVMPGIKISTKVAYSNVNPSKPKIPVGEIIKTPIESWKQYLINDFEKPLTDLHPELIKIKNTMYQHGAVYASLSGSGSSFYGIFNEDPKLRIVKTGFPTLTMKLNNE